MKHRIFISIEMPEELKKIAEKYIEPFRESDLTRIGENSNWHITVVFCGYLDDRELNNLKKITEKISKEIKKFELIPDKIIFAPPNKKPRMVWLTFKPSQIFLKLCRSFSEFSQDIREPTPHLTLVRFEQKHYPNLKKLLPENGFDLKKEAKSFIVDSINIMESHLSPRGPKYELICRNYLK
ncbi:MAG: RNA 2',3'-cyclic phosphodiesterase [Patescibacteria group bacterium]